MFLSKSLSVVCKFILQPPFKLTAILVFIFEPLPNCPLPLLPTLKIVPSFFTKTE